MLCNIFLFKFLVLFCTISSPFLIKNSYLKGHGQTIRTVVLKYKITCRKPVCIWESGRLLPRAVSFYSAAKGYRRDNTVTKVPRTGVTNPLRARNPEQCLPRNYQTDGKLLKTVTLSGVAARRCTAGLLSIKKLRCYCYATLRWPRCSTRVRCPQSRCALTGPRGTTDSRLPDESRAPQVFRQSGPPHETLALQSVKGLVSSPFVSPTRDSGQRVHMTSSDAGLSCRRPEDRGSGQNLPIIMATGCRMPRSPSRDKDFASCAGRINVAQQQQQPFAAVVLNRVATNSHPETVYKFR